MRFFFPLSKKVVARWLPVASMALLAATARAATGLAELPGSNGDGPVTVFYPSSAQARPVQQGPFTLNLAANGLPMRGNGRLIVISHGSSGSPWVHGDLARALVDAGFVVALPEHRGDNFRDAGDRGPTSWKKRPVEVSRAIDAIANDLRFAPLLSLEKVGMYGMSAGGHTALSLAGGRWSPARLRQHCEAHIADDFHTCVGLFTRLRGDWLDGLKKFVALTVIRLRLGDANWYSYHDPRIRAVVAGVPFAVDFDAQSLAAPRVPLGLITVGQDMWLTPRFHSGPIVQACTPCERIADLPTAGHGALLSPSPPIAPGTLAADLLGNPPGFNRASLPAVDQQISAFFLRHLRP